MTDTSRAIASQIVRFLDAHRLSQPQLLMLLREGGAGQDNELLLCRTAQMLRKTDGDVSVSDEGLTGIIAVLQDTFGFELDESQVPRRGRRLLAAFARLVGAVLCFCAFYFVLGGIAAGESSLTQLYGAPIWFTFIVLLSALLLLGSLEGTQIAIVALTDKKVAGFKTQYPQGCRAIKLVQNKRSVERYLAGRQFFVIFVVFVIAQVTSFPNIETLPFTSVTIQSLPEVVIFLGFKLGLFGALLVLWVAQLLPQFVANKNPLFFLNLPGMQSVIRLCLLLESVGPTRPANWLSAAHRDELTVPTSAFVKHKDLVDDVFGYEVLNQSHVWTLDSAQQWSFEFLSAFGIRSEGITQMKEKSLQLHGSVGQAQFVNTLYQDGSARQPLVRTPGVESSSKGNGWTQFEQLVQSKEEFKVGDVVQSTYRFDGTGRAEQAYVAISKPTKLVSFRIRLQDRTLSGTCLVVKKYSQDDVTAKAELLLSRELSFEPSDTPGVQEAAFIDVHPKLNVFYELEWAYDVKASAPEAPSQRAGEAAPFPLFSIEPMHHDDATTASKPPF
jgi:hypothetical protein